MIKDIEPSLFFLCSLFLFSVLVSISILFHRGLNCVNQNACCLLLSSWSFLCFSLFLRISSLLYSHCKDCGGACLVFFSSVENMWSLRGGHCFYFFFLKQHSSGGSSAIFGILKLGSAAAQGLLPILSLQNEGTCWSQWSAGRRSLFSQAYSSSGMAMALPHC